MITPVGSLTGWDKRDRLSNLPVQTTDYPYWYEFSLQGRGGSSLVSFGFSRGCPMQSTGTWTGVFCAPRPPAPRYEHSKRELIIKVMQGTTVRKSRTIHCAGEGGSFQLAPNFPCAVPSTTVNHGARLEILDGLTSVGTLTTFPSRLCCCPSDFPCSLRSPPTLPLLRSLTSA